MNSDIDLKRRAKKAWLETGKIFNVILISLPFAFVWRLYYSKNAAVSYGWKGIYTVIAIYMLLYTLLGRIYGGFTIRTPRRSEIVYSQFLAFFISDAVIYIVICLISDGLVNALYMLLTLVVQFGISVIWVFTAHGIYYRVTPPAKTVVVQDKRETPDELLNRKGMDRLFNVIRYVSVDECLRDMDGTLKGADVVFLYGIHSHERNQIVKHCLYNHINSFIIPRIGDMIMSGAEPLHLFPVPVLTVENYNPSPFFLAVKRAFDLIVSLTALIILSPLMIVIAIIIKSDGGTALYKQVRLTQGGREFNVLKFRSMRMDAEKDGVARLSSGENDPRITPIGHFIRKCRIDELPQLFNILKGDMSIVGPRPERPEIAREYEKIMPEFSLRLQAKAGLTGLAQVYGKYNTTPYDKLLMDLQYIAHPSITQDLMIMFATVKILFLPESTEGVAVGQTTAMDNDNIDK